MVKYCILCGRLPDNIATHRFPIGARRVEWVAYVERQDNLAQVTESSMLCSRHFNPHDYNMDAVRSLLNRRAIPTINAVEEWRHINQQQNMLVEREVITVELVIVQPDEEVVIVQPDDLPLPQGNELEDAMEVDEIVVIDISQESDIPSGVEVVHVDSTPPQDAMVVEIHERTAIKTYG